MTHEEKLILIDDADFGRAARPVLARMRKALQSIRDTAGNELLTETSALREIDELAAEALEPMPREEE